VTHSASPHRCSIVEYQEAEGVVAAASTATGVPETVIERLLTATGERLRESLRTGSPPVQVRRESVLVADVAGLLRLSPVLELEIAPKFLGNDWQTWREDFFVLATLSRHGRVLPRSRVSAGHGARDDLATLIGRSIAGMYWENHRRPLRTYRRRPTVEFTYDGDVDEESIAVPEADGFRQTRVTFDRANRFNATIQAAVVELLPEVRDSETRKQLSRVYDALAPQRQASQRHRPRTVPTRARVWQPLYDLSRQVADGFGLHLERGGLSAPGFVMNTWRCWEDLVFLGARAGASLQVSGQRPFTLGERTNDGIKTSVSVCPDVTVGAESPPVLLVDAKYKGRVERGRTRMAEADIYEAMAFLEATGAERIVLAYPRIPRAGDGVPTTGACTEFERVVIGRRTIIGVELEVRGISRAGGFRAFTSGMGAGLAPWLTAP